MDGSLGCDNDGFRVSGWLSERWQELNDQRDYANQEGRGFGDTWTDQTLSDTVRRQKDPALRLPGTCDADVCVDESGYGGQWHPTHRPDEGPRATDLSDILLTNCV